MRWTVEGADANTGTGRAVTVEAKSQEEAEAKARYGGLLVSHAYPSGSRPAAALASPARPAPPTAARPELNDRPAPPSSAPAYAAIVTGAKSLEGLAVLARIVGFASFALAAVVTFMPFLSSKPPLADVVGVGVMSSLAPAGFGVYMFIVAAVLRMLASIGLAVRDIARNSFGR